MRMSTFASGAVALASLTSFGFAQAPASSAPDQRAQAQWRRMVDHLESLPAFTFDFTTRNLTTADGLHMEYYSRYAVSVERPNRYALRFMGGMSAPEYFCDGTKLWIHLPNAQQYQVLEAPSDAMEALDPDRLGYLGEFYRAFLADAPGLRTLLSNHPAEATAGIADQLAYVGLEQIDGVSAHHLRIDDSTRGHDVWIAAQDPPYPVRFAFEPATSDWDPTGYWEETRTVHSITLTNWSGSPDLTDASFAFVAPEGATEVDDLASAMMGGMDEGGGEGDASELLGTPAAEFELESLEGDKVTLASLREGNRVVVLDFWATWCPPCREGLPVLAETMAAYPEDKAVFYAVNLMEDAATAKAFVKGEGLSIHVLLDSGGTVAEKYGVTGIPQTVVIGLDGTIQSIHVGFRPTVADQLKMEIDTLLAGESLAEARQQATAEQLEVANLEEVWTLTGAWWDVAVDGAGSIYALGGGGNRVARISPDGKVISQVSIDGQDRTLRLARLVEGSDEVDLITFGIWGESVNAFGSDGKKLWSYSKGQGVDDVWPADLDGDGLDEVIVGYNGNTGLHVLSHDGQLRWKYTGIGNVWHVTAANVTGDEHLEVITTSAAGQVHVFDKDGTSLKNINPGLYGSAVSAVSGSPTREPAIYVAGSRMNSSEAVAKLNFEGEREWMIGISGESASIMSIRAASEAPRAAVLTRSGSLHLIDTDKGELVGQYTGHQGIGGAAWLTSDSADNSPLLLIATGRVLLAAREKAAP